MHQRYARRYVTDPGRPDAQAATPSQPAFWRSAGLAPIELNPYVPDLRLYWGYD